ncbi:hypothetical protein RvY_05536 [Ramazzottius varieornatus]|uniref:Uncharacterized protein n=1 Tax=Ramazzottius varieornatus TaxID=947166 RepID=A0A1D1UVW8_RAMVA|nr:hypothetical protein RvY_05536 [Ramazzottius varieornatus]
MNGRKKQFVVKARLLEESNEKAKPKDDVLDVIQTAGLVAEPTPSVDSHVAALAVELDKFMPELLETQKLTQMMSKR